MKQIARFALVPLLSILLTACGGSGDEDASVDASAAALAGAAGLYVGDIVDANAEVFGEYEMLVLEDGSLWAFYERSTADGYGASFAQGNVEFKDGKAKINNLKDFGFAPAEPATATGTYENDLFNGSYQVLGTDSTLKGRKLGEAVVYSEGDFSSTSSMTYDYDTAATVAAIAKTWSFQLSTNEFTTVDIDASGNIAGSTFDKTCEYTGKATPRASGKNVFDITINFKAGCALANQTVTGVGIVTVYNQTYTNVGQPSYGYSDPTFKVALKNADRTLGLIGWGSDNQK